MTVIFGDEREPFLKFSEQQSCPYGILAKPQDAYAAVEPCPSHEPEANGSNGFGQK